MRRQALIAGVLILTSSAWAAADHLLVWVALSEAERVEVVDLTERSIFTGINVNSAPTHLVVSPDLDYLYVCCRSDGQTHVVRPLTGAPVKRLPYVHPIFIPGDSTHYYAPGLGGVFRYEVDGYHFEQLAYLPDTQSSYDYAVSDDGEWFVYVQHFVDWRGRGIVEEPVYERVAVCNLAESTGTYVELGFEPLSVAVTPTGEYALVGGENGTALLLALDDPPRNLFSDSFEPPVRFVGFSLDATELYFASGNLVFSSWVRCWDSPESASPDYRVHRAAEDVEIVDGAVVPDGRLVLLDGAGRLFLVDPADDEGDIEPVMDLESASMSLTAALVDGDEL